MQLHVVKARPMLAQQTQLHHTVSHTPHIAVLQQRSDLAKPVLPLGMTMPGCFSPKLQSNFQLTSAIHDLSCTNACCHIASQSCLHQNPALPNNTKAYTKFTNTYVQQSGEQSSCVTVLTSIGVLAPSHFANETNANAVWSVRSGNVKLNAAPLLCRCNPRHARPSNCRASHIVKDCNIAARAAVQLSIVCNAGQYLHAPQHTCEHKSATQNWLTQLRFTEKLHTLLMMKGNGKAACRLLRIISDAPRQHSHIWARL